MTAQTVHSIVATVLTAVTAFPRYRLPHPAMSLLTLPVLPGSPPRAIALSGFYARLPVSVRVDPLASSSFISPHLVL